MNNLLLVAAFMALQCLDLIQGGGPMKRESVVDKGDHLLICSQEPIEFGIVLDSSSSITTEDYAKARTFLVHFLTQFDIGTGKNDVRVSAITFGKGIYPSDGFNLDTFTTKQEVLDHVGSIRHRQGPYTDTGLAIQYMHNVQFAADTVRPHAEKISLVVTDGNSQRWSLTKREAAKARADNITMFALGIGSARQVSMRELLRIAGDESRVTRVDNFDKLDTIREILAKKTCIKKEKPTTTTPLPMIEPCGVANPADVTFFFSPADLGKDATAWTTSVISNTVIDDEMQDGFRYSVRSGSCPDDEGFHLNTYTSVDDIRKRLSTYEGSQLASLVNMDAFSDEHGGRATARDVAVIFLSGARQLKDGELAAKVKELADKNVEVYIGNSAGYPIEIAGATALSGRSARAQSEDFIAKICPDNVSR